MKKNAQLSHFLKEKRIASGLSQGDVADKLGYSTAQFISNWERGVAAPPVNILKKLAELYKVNAEELFEVVLEEKIREVTNDLLRRFKRAGR